MKRVNVLHDIVPLTEFRARTAELIDQMKKSQSPIVLTQHGRAVAVVMPPAEYEELAYREEFVQAVREGIAEADAGKLIPHDEVMAWLKERRDAWVRDELAAGRDPERGSDIPFEEALARADKRMAEEHVRKRTKRKSKGAAKA
jgi:prevent-host-death family protein